MVRLTVGDRNTLSEWIALKATPEIYEIFNKLGFRDVGHLVNIIEGYNERPELRRVNHDEKK